MPCSLTTNLFYPHILQKQILSVTEPKENVNLALFFMTYIGVGYREQCRL